MAAVGSAEKEKEAEETAMQASATLASSPAERRKAKERAWLAVGSPEKEAEEKATRASPTLASSPAEGRKTKERAWLAVVDSAGTENKNEVAIESEVGAVMEEQCETGESSESPVTADHRPLVSSRHDDNAGHKTDAVASAAAQKRLRTRARARVILKIAAHMMRGVQEMQKAAQAKQEHVRRLNEAAAKGGPNSPTKAERISAVTELVNARRKETRAARVFTPKKKKRPVER